MHMMALWSWGRHNPRPSPSTCGQPRLQEHHDLRPLLSFSRPVAFAKWSLSPVSEQHSPNNDEPKLQKLQVHSYTQSEGSTFPPEESLLDEGACLTQSIESFKPNMRRICCLLYSNPKKHVKEMGGERTRRGQSMICVESMVGRAYPAFNGYDTEVQCGGRSLAYLQVPK